MVSVWLATAFADKVVFEIKVKVYAINLLCIYINCNFGMIFVRRYVKFMLRKKVKSKE